MDHGDRKQIIAEDGSVYEVEAVHIPNSLMTHAMVVNDEMPMMTPQQHLVCPGPATLHFSRSQSPFLLIFGQRLLVLR